MCYTWDDSLCNSSCLCLHISTCHLTERNNNKCSKQEFRNKRIQLFQFYPSVFETWDNLFGSYKEAAIAVQKRLVRRLFRHASQPLRSAAAAAAIDEKRTPQ